MTKLTGTCPVCDASVIAANAVEESEILTCRDCQSRLVVEKAQHPSLELAVAPEVEEDWGQ